MSSCNEIPQNADTVYLISEQEFSELAMEGNYRLSEALADEGLSSLLKSNYNMRELLLKDASSSRDSTDYSFSISYCTFSTSGEAKRAYNESIWSCEEDSLYKQVWTSDVPYVEYENNRNDFYTQNYQGSNYSMHTFKYDIEGIVRRNVYYCIGCNLIFMSVHGESNSAEAERVLLSVVNSYADDCFNDVNY